MYKKPSPKRYKSNLLWIMQLEGIKAEFIAKRLNLSCEYVRQISRGENTPGEETLRKIAQLVNRPFEEVFGDARPLPKIMIAVPQQNQAQAQS